MLVILFLRLVTNYMIWRWGIHGGLKPPIAPVRIVGYDCSTGGYADIKGGHIVNWEPDHASVVPVWEKDYSLFKWHWYLWRRFCWIKESSIYDWTGIPEVWHKRYCADMGLSR